MAHLAHVGVTITISVPLITGMHPHHRSLQYLHHSICVHLQQVPHGIHLRHTLDQKTKGTTVTEILAPVMGWISTKALSKLLHLPLRYFASFFTALLDCGASHNFISEGLVNQIGTVTPTKVEPMPIWLADQSVMTSDHSVTLPIWFILYHICNFFPFYCIYLNTWYVAWNGVVFLIFTDCELDFMSCDLKNWWWIFGTQGCHTSMSYYWGTV